MRSAAIVSPCCRSRRWVGLGVRAISDDMTEFCPTHNGTHVPSLSSRLAAHIAGYALAECSV